ncbi:MAG TPA: c-type cytochrome, partial [Bryobacterales bacterium]|nr:c-type cytochrome [Bryobacterales bacterium]
NLGAASTAELVRQLASPNGWNRETAQRLLVDRQDRAAIPLLEEMAAKNEMPQARLRALWTLEGLSALSPALVERALHDSHPAIRENVLRLSEPLLANSKPLTSAVLAMAKDPEPRVQLQLAFTLGEVQDPRAMRLLADLASAHTGDRWFRTAVLSSVHDSAFPFFAMLQQRPKRWGDAQFLSALCALIGARHKAPEMTQAINTLAGLRGGDAELWQAAGLAGLGRGLEISGASGLKIPAAEASLMKMVENPAEKTQKAARALAQHIELRALIQKASEQALADKLPVPAREMAVRSLRGGQFAVVSPVLRKVLDPKEPPELQAAAVDSLAAFDDSAVSSILLDNWRTYDPEVRKRALLALLENRDRAPVLLKAMESHQIEPSAFDASARDRLLENPDPGVRQRAQALFLNSGSDRAKVVQAYRGVADLTGDPARGKQVFEKNCGKCHLPRRLGGQRVGPDLSGVNNKTKEELLTSILNPSAEIEPRFTNYVVVTQDNRMHDGIIVSETGGTLTLRGDSEEGDVTILRQNISEIRASSVSLMPDDFEKQLSKQDLADVIAHLRAGL